MSGPHHRVMVVGAGIAGVSCVAALRTGGYDGELVLLDPGPFPYDRPPLSKEYLAGERTLDRIALQRPEWYAEHRIDLRTGTTVTRLRPEPDRVTLTTQDGDELTTDRVVLATGGRAAVPPVPGLEPARAAGRVHLLREYADADRLRESLAPGRRLLVVGGGLIGAEAAATAWGSGAEVVLVDPLDPPLAAAVGLTTARWLHGQHAAYGVETVTTTLASLQLGPDHVAAQLHGEPDARVVDAVLIGVGMVPETALAEEAGLGVDRGILVDGSQTTSHPRVLAVGDAARPRHHHRSEHWEAARLDGERAAATLLGTPPPTDAAPWFWTERYGRHVEVVGELREPDAAHTVVGRGEPGDAPFAIFCLRGDRLIGAVAVDDPKAAKAARRLIERGTPVDPDRLADPGTDLRRLLSR